MVSEKDQNRIEQRRHEESKQVQEFESNDNEEGEEEEYNDYMRMMGKMLGINEQDMASGVHVNEQNYNEPQREEAGPGRQPKKGGISFDINFDDLDEAAALDQQNNQQITAQSAQPGERPEAKPEEMQNDLPYDDAPEDQADEGNEEIDFDQLLGDAAQSQADYEEDREDNDFDDEETEVTLEEHRQQMADSLAFSNTAGSQ